MTDINFSRLQDLPLRDAWKHEALEFTPWLAANIDHLSEVIGIPLELTGTEVAVDTFSADILARSSLDGATVLIENQLETTDHTHLGQIMTYLAGLDAKIVVWIAPSFREPHLSAIHWLNEHTADGFSFFAIKARVVRIDNSPYAPIFETVAQPNGWERQIRSKERTVSRPDAHSNDRLAFWSALAAAYPKLEDSGPIANRTWNAWVPVWEDPEINLSFFVGQRACGAFLRGARGGDATIIEDHLGPCAADIIRTVGADRWQGHNKSHFAPIQLQESYLDQSNWPKIITWMGQAHTLFKTAVAQAMTP